MKKIFTLIAAVFMAVGVYAEDMSIPFGGLTKDDATYNPEEYTWNADKKCFDLIKKSESEYSDISFSGIIAFQYKNKSGKSKAFTFNEDSFCAQSKGTMISVDDTGGAIEVGDVLVFSVGSKGGTASSFSVVSGCEVVGEMPEFAPKGEVCEYKDVKVKVTESPVVIKETAGGFVISKLTVVKPAVTDGITSVDADAAKDGKVYNFAGQQVSENAKGILIKNGKKYVK